MTATEKPRNQFPMAKGLIAKILEQASEEERAAMLVDLAEITGLEEPLPAPEEAIAEGDQGRYARFRGECRIEIMKCEREIARTENPAHWYARQKEIEKIIELSEKADTIEAKPRRFFCKRENAQLHMYEMRDTLRFRRRIYETSDPLELARLDDLMERRKGYLREIPAGHVALLTAQGEWDGVYSPEDADDRLKRGISRYPHR